MARHACTDEATSDIYEFPLVDRDPVRTWTFGRVTLIGDAAHPMQPIGSQAGSQPQQTASIAVGTLIAERPPHRTVRAAFPHTAPTLGNDGSTTRMQSNDWYTYAGAVSDARVALDCIPLGPRPSLHRLRRRSLSFAHRLHRYYGSV